jgi:hypothetical protein
MLTRYNNSLMLPRRHDHVEQAVARRSTPVLKLPKPPRFHFDQLYGTARLFGDRGAAWKLAHLEAAVELGTR